MIVTDDLTLRSRSTTYILTLTYSQNSLAQVYTFGKRELFVSINQWVSHTSMHR